MKQSADALLIAMDQLEKAVTESVKAALNDLRTQVLRHYHNVNERLDEHAKAIRANTAELLELRRHIGLPEVARPPDVL